MRKEGLRYHKSTTQMSPVLMNCNGKRNNQHQGGLTQDTSGRVSGDFGRYKLDKIIAGREGKKYPARQYEVCVTHKK
jgi:hypothetical protein